jgi:hypothetical protein
MKNSGGSLAFNGQDNSDKSGKSNTQYDYNQSRLTPKTTGVRTNLVGNSAALGKPSPQGDTASNDHGPISGTAKPMNRHDGSKTDKHVTTLTRGSRTNLKGNV